MTLALPKLKFEFIRLGSGRIEANAKRVVGVKFTGDILRIGYAPSAPVLRWLYVPPTVAGEPSRDFNLDVEAFPTSEAPGTYLTTLRFAATREDGSGLSQVDLPVEMVVHSAPPIHEDVIEFVVAEGSGQPPARTIQLDLGTLHDVELAAAIENGNSVTSDWLQISMQGEQLTVQPRAGVAPGRYEGWIAVRYKAFGMSDVKRIPVQMNVTATRAALSYATLSPVAAGREGVLIVRGQGFVAGQVAGVKLGGQSAASIEVVNDTQIVARFPAVPAHGMHNVTVTVGGKDLTIAGAVDVLPSGVLPAANFDFGEAVKVSRYDARHRALMVVTETRLRRLEVVDGVWQEVVSTAFDRPTFEFTPDYRRVVVVYPTHIALLDARTLAPIAQFDLPNSSTGARGYEWVNLLAVMNNGDVVLTLPSPTQYAGRLAIYSLVNRTLTLSPFEIVMPMVGTTTMRDRLFLASNWEQASFKGWYLAEQGEFKTTTLPATGVYSNQFSFASSGSAVLLNNTLYPLPSGSPVNVRTLNDLGDPVLSPDGQRVYVVDEESGRVRPFSLSAGEWVEGATVTFPAFSYYAAGPDSMVTPDGRTLVLTGGWLNFNTLERRLVIVPLP